MDQKKEMSRRSRANSFMYAFNGLRLLFREEPNVKLHTIAAVCAVVAGVIRHIMPAQWIAIVVAIGIVWITEALNTCVEKLCDYCCGGQYHPAIKIIKDIAAAAVLIAAVVSVVIAIIVFFFWV